MILVADTGPLVGLAKIRVLMQLKHLTDTVLISPAVRRELLGGAVGDEGSVLEEALGDLLRVERPGTPAPNVEEAVMGLDPGERSVVTLAATRNTSEADVVVLMDDQAGRRVAREVGLPVTGLIGVLLRLKEIGAIEAVTPHLETVRERGYWLSDEIIATARRLAGEN